MKTLLKIFLILVFVTPALLSQDTTKVKKNNKKQCKFVDKNKDGYNDNAPDHDGDGIPNGLDPDFKKQKGKQKRFGKFIDKNGNGIDDRKEKINKLKSQKLNYKNRKQVNFDKNQQTKGNQKKKGRSKR